MSAHGSSPASPVPDAARPAAAGSGAAGPKAVGPAARTRRALAGLGGVASARAVAAAVALDGGDALSVRQVREALRGRDVRVLGGGYLALGGAPGGLLLPWVRARLRAGEALPLDQVVDEILARWPHGDAVAVRAWLHQDPPGLAVIDGRVRAPGRR